MSIVVFSSDKKFIEKTFPSEENFEQIVKDNSKLLFGTKTIYLDFKNKVDARSLGGTIPDAFLFDLSDKEDPQFYLIEVELSKHDFFSHIFPQITKFFTFYRNSSSRGLLVEKIYEFIKNNPKIQEEFKSFLDTSEIHKSVQDIIENSQNILIIIDNPITAIKEIQETYTDTWAKYVKIEILKVFTDSINNIFTFEPDFQQIKDIGAADISEETDTTKEIYDESYHLDGVDPSIVSIYNKIKQQMIHLDETIAFNPQHYYISTRKKRNFAFIKTRIHKLKITIMLPYEDSSSIKNHIIRKLSEGVQNFYNGPCFEVIIENDKNLDDILKLLERAYQKQI